MADVIGSVGKLRGLLREMNGERSRGVWYGGGSAVFGSGRSGWSYGCDIVCLLYVVDKI